jgi:histidine phosphotransferase ChpT
MQITLDSLDLAALLTSRVCHDVINPIGAIVNGLEVLEDDKDGEMRDFALGLIKKSAKQASARLQFARLAFGAGGAAGSVIDTGDAETVARGFLQDDRTTVTWNGARSFMPKNKVKLLLNLLVIAGTTIPRGGSLSVEIGGSAEAPVFTIATSGSYAKVPAHVETLWTGASESGAIDSHAIQPFYTGLLARAADMSVGISAEPDGARIIAQPV